MNSTETVHASEEEQLLAATSEDDSHPLESAAVISAEDQAAALGETTRSDNSGDLATTFSLFKSYLDKKLSTLKEDLKEEAQSSTDSVAKKLKASTELNFKYEGNKQQHKFTSILSDHVAAAKKALQRKSFRTLAKV